MGAPEKLKEKFRWIYNFKVANTLMQWDYETHMPKKAAEKRAEALGELSVFIFNYTLSDEMGELIQKAEKEATNDIDRALVYFAKKDYEKYKKIPPKLWKDFSIETAKAQAIWEKAKAESDFSIFSEQLKKVIELSIEVAEHLGYEKNRYDALLDLYEPGTTSEDIEKIIKPLKSFLKEAVEKILSKEKPQDVFKIGIYDIEKQKLLSKKVLELIGYDFSSGRIDISAHPFTITIGPNDVRVTTRYDEHDLKYSLYSTIHEGGHALYELGIPLEFYGLPIGDAASMAIHESQSRFWENVIGRSYSFWKFFKPILERYFDTFKKHTTEELWRASNIVERSLIRTEADEVTYNLHIMLRFDIENALINRELSVDELPSIWNEKMEEYIGVVPKNDSEGVLQDVHWSHGSFGYFPSYMLGNLYSAQIYHTMQKEIDVESHVENGDFERILEWLRDKVHSKGRTKEPKDLIREISGEELNPEHFIRYIKEKYSKVYEITL